MRAERLEKFRQVVAKRQPNLTVILENVHDVHNIGAVMRSCDSVGIREIFVLYTETHLKPRDMKLGKRTSAGTRRWMDVHLFYDVETCFRVVRAKYDSILGTHLNTEAKDLYDLELSGSVALLFGNERKGLSAEALKHCDGNFIIPQAGMAQSLNISVACAVTLYEAYRQRRAEGYYDHSPLMSPEQQDALLQDYINRHEEKRSGKRFLQFPEEE